MSRLPRVTQQLFASLAGSNQIAQFGSLYAGTPGYATTIAQAMSYINWQEGWFNAAIGNNSPAIEDFNAFCFVAIQQIAYLLQLGLPEWDTGTTYYIGSTVQDGSGNQYVSLQNNNTNNSLATTAYWQPKTLGAIPIGSVISTFPNLTGAYSTVATTAADINGYVLCQGQTIVDATSPMNGAVIPNINNSVFLMGSNTAGSAGGNNNTTLTTTQLPAHTHTPGSFATSVGVTGGTASLTGTTSFAATGHTHNFSHTHIWSSLNAGQSTYTKYSSDTSSSTIGTGGIIAFQYNSTSYAPQPGTGIGAYASGAGASGSPNYYTTGVAGNLNSGSGNSALTGTESADASVGISSTAASMTGSNSVTGTSASTGSGSAYDSRPNFISTVYLMRIE